MKVLEVLKKLKRIVVVDQQDLEKDYGFSWKEFNSFYEKLEKTRENLIFNGMVDGFEEAVWEYEIDGIKIREITTYGQGSITELEII